MDLERMVMDYTRVSDDAAILCRRRDFPRAVNVLQRRSPDRRRWRQAFRTVAVTADRNALDPKRRGWVEGALREVVSGVRDKGLQGELVLDAAAYNTQLELGEFIPRWTARELWRQADAVALPMEYLKQVTTLPTSIDAPIHAARVIVDCRRTADAHRALAVELTAALDPRALVDEYLPSLDRATLSRLEAMRAQQDAARRWRELAQRLFRGQ
ncbi:MAG: hypothetical protein JNK72_12775 [Myxococcales bacterium]|nr:hypothetical protein [Myxococcales bacterium]